MPEDTGTADPARPAGRDRGRGAVRGHGGRPTRCRAPCTCSRPGRPALARGAAPAGPGRDRVAHRELRQVGRLPQRQAEGAPQGLRRDPRRSTREFARVLGRAAPAVRAARRAIAPLWRISTSPRAGPKVVAAISAYMECRAFYDWSGGLVWARGAADDRCRCRRHPPCHRHARGACHVDPGRAAGACRRRGVPAAGAGAGASSRASSRQRSIPAGILNPGRMYARISEADRTPTRPCRPTSRQSS